MNPAHSKSSIATRPLTSGAILTWLLFSLVTLAIACSALTSAGRLYDFRSFYAAGYLLLHHPHRIFDLSLQDSVQNAIVYPMWRGVPFYHPAYEAILYAPFTLLHYQTAYFIYIACNLLLFAACYLLAPPASDPTLRKVPRTLFFFLAFPALMCVVQGQDSILFLFLLCLIWRSLYSENDTVAGILLALALFKLQLVLSLTFFIAVFLRRRRRSRLLLGFLPTATALMLTCTSITGISGNAQWLHLLASTAVASHFGRHAQSVAAIVPESMPSLNGFLYALGTHALSPHVALVIDVFVVLLIFACALLLTLRARTLPVAFSIALVASLLLAPHLFLYDYLPILFPLLLLRGRLLPLIAALYYVAPIALCFLHELRWTALMAIIPIAILLTTDGKFRLHQTDPEKVTPHPLTSLE